MRANEVDERTATVYLKTVFEGDDRHFEKRQPNGGGQKMSQTKKMGLKRTFKPACVDRHFFMRECCHFERGPNVPPPFYCERTIPKSASRFLANRWKGNGGGGARGRRVLDNLFSVFFFYSFLVSKFCVRSRVA